MDEAERLCDRVAVIDRGRVVALHAPAALAERDGGGNHMRFRPSRPVEDRVLTEIPGVTTLGHEGARLVVTGAGDLLNAVVRALATEGVEALEIQLERASLEDAFLRLIEPSRNPKEVTPS